MTNEDEPESAPAPAEQEPDMASKKKAKAKSKSKKKAAPKKPTGPGVIATILETMKRKNGATVEEMVAVLVKKFPKRRKESMTSTVKIQAAKNAKKKENDERRGLVYYG